MGVYGEILYPLLNPVEISPQSSYKRWNDRGEFKLDRARSENNIAENSFALGHETHNRFYIYINVSCTTHICMIIVLYSGTSFIPMVYSHATMAFLQLPFSPFSACTVESVLPDRYKRSKAIVVKSRFVGTIFISSNYPKCKSFRTLGISDL